MTAEVCSELCSAYQYYGTQHSTEVDARCGGPAGRRFLRPHSLTGNRVLFSPASD
ncbi:hypothetical protein Esi_0012_0156 [Ectocarpus siliculosus]|uniref:Uncharacterized protein n=1 Tax=Ectocarpus siliculosus TaxID=2880 RepID=D8LDK7_ECTSI|nr:hypothetical protein Esi_0012_0156 [Ectocarpus siliculosus]|eukprot:CBN74081.1 hypothetical protein Esi_0012_0156 [Ectocarpus siliculosus]